MRTPLLVTLAAATALAVLFLDLPDGVRIGLKAIPCLCMAWIAWMGAGHRNLRTGVTVALLFSVLGDVILEVRDRPDLFVPGLVAFLIAHVAYVGAFASEERHPALPWLAFVLLWIGGTWGHFSAGLGELLVPVAVYVGVITTMIWRAVAFGLRGGTAGAAAIGGAVLFGVSDSLIAVNKFTAPMPAADLFILTTYWLGQTGLCAAAALPTPPPRAR